MGKLRDFAGAVEDAVSEFGEMVRSAADELLGVDAPLYVGDTYEVFAVSVTTRNGSEARDVSVVLERGDRITHISNSENGILVERRHKLASGDSERTLLLLSFGEWTMLRGRVSFTWTNQAELAKLHRMQGHG